MVTYSSKWSHRTFALHVENIGAKLFMLRKTDLWWLCAYPLYQIIGTIRHEALHTIGAHMEGAQVTEFVFFPSFHHEIGFRWGYVSLGGDTSWVTYSAPYLGDMFTYLCFFLICMFVVNIPRWLWLNLGIVGLLSPILNSLYNYLRGFFRPNTDVAVLFRELPSMLVHVYFIGTLLLYCIGVYIVVRYSKMATRCRSIG